MYSPSNLGISNSLIQSVQMSTKPAELQSTTIPMLRPDMACVASPRWILFKNGTPAARKVGAMSTSALKGWLEGELQVAGQRGSTI